MQHSEWQVDKHPAFRGPGLYSFDPDLDPDPDPDPDF